MRILILLLALAVSMVTVRADPITVFAAASLRGPLDEAVAAWPGASVDRPRIVYAGTAALARQLREGAPADVFISANAAWMDALAADGVIAPSTRIDLLGNRLVLVAGSPIDAAGHTLGEIIGDANVAMALVNAVPAGVYGREALIALGAWRAIRPRVVEVANVRVALALASRGEVDFAIVYATDARLEPGLFEVFSFPPHSHGPIVYAAAATAEAADGATAFLNWLSGPEAMAVFARAGFRPAPTL